MIYNDICQNVYVYIQCHITLFFPSRKINRLSKAMPSIIENIHDIANHAHSVGHDLFQTAKTEGTEWWRTV